MKIAILVPEYANEESRHGGLSAVADFLVSTFQSQEWDVEIISPRSSSVAEQSSSLVRPRTWRNRPVVTTRTAGKVRVTDVGSHFSEIEWLRYAPRRILDRELRRFDCIVVVAGSPAIAHSVARTSRPVVLQVATFVDVERSASIAQRQDLARVSLQMRTAVTSMLDRRAVAIPDVVLVENEWMRERCESYGAREVRLCPPGIDTDFFVPRAAKSREDAYLLSVGRFGDPRKNFEGLVRAYANARIRGVTQNLILAGAGRPGAALLETIAGLGLASNVEILTNLPRCDLRDLIQEAGLFLLFSREEGLGLVLIEAMACGVPVIATATEGAKHVVGISAAGDLVPVGDHEAMGSAISRWCDDNDLRARGSAAARDRAVKVFSLQATGQEFVQAVRDAVQSKVQDAC